MAKKPDCYIQVTYLCVLVWVAGGAWLHWCVEKWCHQYKGKAVGEGVVGLGMEGTELLMLEVGRYLAVQEEKL